MRAVLCVCSRVLSRADISAPWGRGQGRNLSGIFGVFLLFVDLGTECPSLSRGIGLGIALMKVALQHPQYCTETGHRLPWPLHL